MGLDGAAVAHAHDWVCLHKTFRLESECVDGSDSGCQSCSPSPVPSASLCLAARQPQPLRVAGRRHGDGGGGEGDAPREVVGINPLSAEASVGSADRLAFLKELAHLVVPPCLGTYAPD